MADLRGKSVLVTGASVGIGRASAVALARAGASIVATARNRAALQSLAAECGRLGVSARTIEGDITDRAFVQRLVAEAGEVDILLNNAGVLTYAPLLDMQADDCEAMFRVNVLAALDVTLGIARKMAARKRGHIIMMSSTAARSVYRMGVVYCASKFALTALTQGLRLEVQGDGVKVTEIAPGMVDTEIRNSSTHPAWLAALKSRTIVPLTVDDVAAAVVFSAGATDNCCPDLIELRPRGAA